MCAAVMADFVARHGFVDYRSYISKTGRARFIEVSVLVPSDLRISIGEFDTLRTEIGDAIGGSGAGPVVDHYLHRRSGTSMTGWRASRGPHHPAFQGLAAAGVTWIARAST